MYFALVYYPCIEDQGFHHFRMKYEPYASLMPVHVPFVFPTPEEVGRKKLEAHISKVLKDWKPFHVHFCKLEKTWDHWLYVGAEEGHDQVVQLHDHLYTGILAPYLRKDLPFHPHIGLGLFSKEKYDFNNPTTKLTLDEEKYLRAIEEFEALHFDLWCTIDCLTLVRLDDKFTECMAVQEYSIN